jgi:hypothetical protein
VTGYITSTFGGRRRSRRTRHVVTSIRERFFSKIEREIDKDRGEEVRRT